MAPSYNDNNSFTFNTNTDYTYSFGFNGWKRLGDPIYDEFEMWVWEQRKAAGIDEPKPEPIGYEPLKFTATSGNISGQILFNGSLTVNSPKFHRMVYGITTGSDNGSNE